MRCQPEWQRTRRERASGHSPSALTEVSYRAGARPHGQLPVALRTRELKKNEPHAGGPIDPAIRPSDSHERAGP